MKKKAEAAILVKVKDKLEVELTREEARQLMETLEAALGSIRMSELETTLRKVLQERVLDNATPFTMIPPVIYDPPSPDKTGVQCFVRDQYDPLV